MLSDLGANFDQMLCFNTWQKVMIITYNYSKIGSGPCYSLRSIISWTCWWSGLSTTWMNMRIKKFSSSIDFMRTPTQRQWADGERSGSKRARQDKPAHWHHRRRRNYQSSSSLQDDPKCQYQRSIVSDQPGVISLARADQGGLCPFFKDNIACLIFLFLWFNLLFFYLATWCSIACIILICSN